LWTIPIADSESGKFPAVLGLVAEQALEPERDVARVFGEDFARELVTIAPGEWVGPIESSFGLHLIFVRERVAGAKPALAEIRPAIEREVQAERRNAQVQALYDRWLAKYVVTIQKPGAEPPASAKTAK